jgi:hypothetical protein
LTYRIIHTIDGRLVGDETDDIFVYAESRGMELSGFNNDPESRAELQGEPQFAGFMGPLWDGDAIRYEGAEACNTLSAN